jgi:hypothetical protein
LKTVRPADAGQRSICEDVNSERASSKERLEMETIGKAILPAFVTVALLLAMLAVMYAVSWLIEFHL